MAQSDREPSSSPLSMASRSPDPYDYPSPLSDFLTELTSPSKSRDTSLGLDGSSDAPGREERAGPPPAKKRKINPPQPRTTETLDLNCFGDARDGYDQDHEEIQVRRLEKALRTKKKIVVIAGAGISVSAGIPDFRSSQGLFKTLKSSDRMKTSGKALFNASVYRSDDSTESFHDMVREMSKLTKVAKPTRFHHMVASLAKEGRLLRMYTQNIDSIETTLDPLITKTPLPLKGPWPATIQLHGGLDKMVCTLCNELSTFRGDLFDGPEAPTCEACEVTDSVRQLHAGKRSRGVGRLRPRIVLYDEDNPDADAIGACSEADLKSRPDAVIVVGTSLRIPGLKRLVKEMCAVTRGRKDGFTVWINKGPEPIGSEFKDSFDLLVQGDCEHVAHMVNLPEWDNKDSFEQLVTHTPEEVKRLRKLRVVINVEGPATPSKPLLAKNGGIPTPQSPRFQSPATPKGPKGKQSKLAFGTASDTKSKATTTKAAALKAATSKASKAAASKAATTKASTSKATNLAKTEPNANKITKTAAPKRKVGRPRKSTATPVLKNSFAVTKSSTKPAAKKESSKSLSLDIPDHESDEIPPNRFAVYASLGRRKRSSETASNDAMRPISPAAIRNNTHPSAFNQSLEIRDSEEDSSLSSIELGSEDDELVTGMDDPGGAGGVKKNQRYMGETVSPKGALPRGLENMLN